MLLGVLLASLLVKQPQFPNYQDNYIKTIVEPAQKAQEAAQAALQAQQPTYTAPTVYYAPLAPNDAKLYIYMHESGNDPKRWNGSGCVGLGQACPASKLTAVCPNLDYACEDNWFTQYAYSVYGGWQQAYNHWLNWHSW